MNRADLVQKLELTGRALASHNLVPMFQCFCFDGETVSAYDDSLGIVVPCKTPQPFALNGSTLLGLLKNSHSEEVEFSLEDKSEVSIKSDKSRFKMPYFGSDDFLFKHPDAEWVTRLSINEDLLRGVDACLLTSSRDMAQPKLLGVNLTAYQKGMALYSCDGDAITRYVIGGKATKGANFLLPNAFCEALLQITKETKTAKGALCINAEWAYAALDNNYEIYGRLIEVDAPVDYEELITKTINGEVKFLPVPKGLDHALSRARVIADPESAKTTLNVNEGKLRLTTETHMGLVKDVLTFDCAYEIVTNVSATMVQRAIGLCDEMAILDRCTVYKHATNLLMVVSNMG